MVKNITLSLTDELVESMEKLSEVNWSHIARDAIKKYIEERRNPDITPLLERLHMEKGEEYVKGRRKAEEIAEKLGYRKLSILLKAYWKEYDKYEEIWTMGEPPPGENVPSPNEIMEELLVKNNLIADESDEYIKGVKERLLDIWRSLQH